MTVNDPGDPNRGMRDLVEQLRSTVDEVYKGIQQQSGKIDVGVSSTLQAAQRSLRQALEMIHQGEGKMGQSGVPATGQDMTSAVGGTDRSSMDPQDDERIEIHPDDQSAPPSDTGHREIHPDDLD